MPADFTWQTKYIVHLILTHTSHTDRKMYGWIVVVGLLSPKTSSECIIGRLEVEKHAHILTYTSR